MCLVASSVERGCPRKPNATDTTRRSTGDTPPAPAPAPAPQPYMFGFEKLGEAGAPGEKEGTAEVARDRSPIRSPPPAKKGRPRKDKVRMVDVNVTFLYCLEIL